MKAILEHDTVLNLIQFRVVGTKVSYIFGVSPKMTDIKEITDYDTEFITIQTNYGEEYMDLIEGLEQSIFPQSFCKRAIKIYESLKLEDITLRKS